MRFSMRSLVEVLVVGISIMNAIYFLYDSQLSEKTYSQVTTLAMAVLFGYMAAQTLSNIKLPAEIKNRR
jgi:hypothetical protein